MPKITTIWAFIAADKDPDDEGLVAGRVGSQWMPLVGADMARVESLKPIARSIAKVTGKKITLAKFEVRTDVPFLEESKREKERYA